MTRNTTGASIVGWAETDAFGELPDTDVTAMQEQVAAEAMSRADLTPSEVDGLVVSPPTGESAGLYAGSLAEELGLLPGLKHGSVGAIGGASLVQNVAVAAQQVAHGPCENVLVIACNKLATGSGGRDEAVENMARVGHPQFESPYGPLIPSMYALAARKHMHEHGTTEAQLAKIAAVTYEHAAAQPEGRAFITEPKTPDEVLDSPMIATPLTLDQCSLVTDGGCGLIVTTEERAHAEYDVPIDVLSFGEYDTHESIHQMPDLTRTGAREAGEQAMGAAGVTHDDLDVLEIYDCFTITVLCVLEDLGFCRKGEGGDLVESGAIELGGRWPTNTHGGLLAQSHHGAAGLMHVVEGVRQLRGEAGPTQVDGAETALVHGNGGILSSQTVAILERGDAS